MTAAGTCSRRRSRLFPTGFLGLGASLPFLSLQEKHRRKSCTEFTQNVAAEPREVPVTQPRSPCHRRRVALSVAGPIARPTAEGRKGRVGPPLSADPAVATCAHGTTRLAGSLAWLWPEQAGDRHARHCPKPPKVPEAHASSTWLDRTARGKHLVVRTSSYSESSLSHRAG